MYRDFYSNRGDLHRPFPSFHAWLSPAYLKASNPIARSAINEDNPSSLPRYDGVVGIGRETWETREEKKKNRSPTIVSRVSLSFSRLYTSIVKF